MFAVIDTETTGLPDNKYAEPVQVAVALFSKDGTEFDSFNLTVLPNIIDTTTYHHAERIHGISLLQLVKEGTPAATAAERLRAWWIGHDRPMLYAYNLSFDEEMLRRMGFAPKGYFGPCIMRAAAERVGRTTGRVSLDSAARHLQVPGRSGSHHHALEDARLAGRVAHALGLFA
jgi:DNA polymerase III epsilon subunit-like protein